MNRFSFVTFSSDHFEKNVFWNKLFIDLFLRPERTFFYKRSDLISDPVYEKNIKLFSLKKGAGLWAWKPLVILRAMEQMSDGDILLYQDCGKGLKYKNFLFPNATMEKMSRGRNFLGYQVRKYGSNGDWTPNNVLEKLGLDSNVYRDCPHLEAVIMFWKVGPESTEMVREWLNLCLKQARVFSALSEQERETFRYDQSLLSIIVEKYKLAYELSCTEVGMLSKSLWVQELGARNQKRLIRSIEFFHDRFR